MIESKEAEMCLLHSILLERAVLDDAIENVKPEDFYYESHKEIFKAIQDMRLLNKSVDLSTLHLHLIASNRLEAVGGEEYLAELCDMVPSSANYKEYKDAVLEASIRRKMFEIGREVARQATSGENVDELIARAVSLFFEMSKRGGGTVRAMDEIAQKAGEEFQYYQEGKVPGIKTGFADLDEATGGLRQTDYVIVAARPSIGKTTFVIGMLRNISQDRPVLLFSLEANGLTIAQSLICSEAGVSLKKIHSGFGSGEDFDLLYSTTNTVKTWPIWICDDVYEPHRIALIARRMASQGIGLIAIDYMQLMFPPPEWQGKSNVEFNSLVSRMFAQLRKELKIPLVGICQLNRGPEARELAHPKMSDIKEAGQYEQDADVVLLLHRPGPWLRDGHPDKLKWKNRADVIVAKQRYGPVGHFPIYFDEALMRFRNWKPDVGEI